VQLRKPEDGHDRVADELLDHSSVSFELGARRVEVAGLTSRRDSESSFSPMAVEPLRSENTMVTVFRYSCTGDAAASADPHARQNLAMSGFSVPHCAQTGTSRVCSNPGAEVGAPAVRPRSLNIYGL